MYFSLVGGSNNKKILIFINKLACVGDLIRPVIIHFRIGSDNLLWAIPSLSSIAHLSACCTGFFKDKFA